VKRLKDIFGQDSAIANLRGAMTADRLAHGLIFAGPEGVGKATCAAALGAFFLCERPESDDACGRCASCRAVAAGTHPDFHVIAKELARLYDKTGISKATLSSGTRWRSPPVEKRSWDEGNSLSLSKRN
jgi:DNA polymerase III gamma/tau subunit